MQQTTNSDKSDRDIFSVSALTSAVNHLLQSNFSWVWVEGEISNLATPASGHIYFSLKDDKSQVRCAMFKSRVRDVRFRPENGLKVLLRGKLGLYEARGDFQVVVDKMEEAGAGLLQMQFEALKQKLAEEGLFSEAIKKAIPTLPQTIGIITSKHGAAVRDVLSVIRRRFPSIPVKLFPVTVQGEAAAPEICNAIRAAEEHQCCDVLLVVRGGGSLEDLWAFNEESVARALYNCNIPIVTGIGHETDFTIADFCADFSAATPTAAAERVTPDQIAWQNMFEGYTERLIRSMNDSYQRRQTRLEHLSTRLKQQHPESILERLLQRTDELEQRMTLACRSQLREQHHRSDSAYSRLIANSPLSDVFEAKKYSHNLARQIQSRMHGILENRRLRFGDALSTINALSPLKVLERGYSISYDESGKAVTQSKNLKVGDRLKTRFNRGQVTSTVDSIES